MSEYKDKYDRRLLARFREIEAQLADAVALLVDVRLHEDGDISARHSAAEWIKRRDALLQALAGEADQ